MTRTSFSPDAFREFTKGMQHPVPAGRAGKSEEIAGTAVYLAARAGAFVSRQELPVDGGYLATNP